MTNGFDILDEVLEGSPAAKPAPSLVSPTGTQQSSWKVGMKVYLLKAMLERAGTVVPTREVVEVLRNFHLTSTGSELRVVASDLELSQICRTSMAELSGPGTALLPAQKLLEIVKSVSGESDIEILFSTGSADVRAGDASWHLKASTGTDYPKMPSVDDLALHEVDRAKFLAGIKSVRLAVAKDASRSNLMMIDVAKGRMTACDGARVQQAFLGDDFPMDMRIPSGAVDYLVKVLESTDQEKVFIGESVNHLVFRIGKDVFIANKLMAAYPDVEELFLRPALENKHRLVVDRAKMVEAIARVRITADPETSAILLVLAPDPKGAVLTVSAADKYKNTAKQDVSVAWDGPAKRLVVNHVYLSQMLTMHAASTCDFYLGEDTKTRKAPILLKDPVAGSVGVLQQMVADWTGYHEKEK